MTYKVRDCRYLCDNHSVGEALERAEIDHRFTLPRDGRRKVASNWPVLLLTARISFPKLESSA